MRPLIALKALLLAGVIGCSSPEPAPADAGSAPAESTQPEGVAANSLAGLTPDALELAAYLGHPEALKALGREAPPRLGEPKRWVRGLRPWGQEVTARAAVALARRALSFRSDAAPQAAVEATEAWIRSPTAERVAEAKAAYERSEARGEALSSAAPDGTDEAEMQAWEQSLKVAFLCTTCAELPGILAKGDEDAARRYLLSLFDSTASLESSRIPLSTEALDALSPEQKNEIGAAIATIHGPRKALSKEAGEGLREFFAAAEQRQQLAQAVAVQRIRRALLPWVLGEGDPVRRAHPNADGSRYVSAATQWQGIGALATIDAEDAERAKKQAERAKRKAEREEARRARQGK